MSRFFDIPPSIFVRLEGKSLEGVCFYYKLGVCSNKIEAKLSAKAKRVKVNHGMGACPEKHDLCCCHCSSHLACYTNVSIGCSIADDIVEPVFTDDIKWANYNEDSHCPVEGFGEKERKRREEVVV